MPTTLPMAIPKRRILTERLMNTCLTKPLEAPIALSRPMVEVFSMMMISSIETTVMPATRNIRDKISHTLVSKSASQSNI